MPGKYGAQILKITAGAFAFTVFSVMLSAFGSIFGIVTGLSPRICSLLAAVLCAVIFCRSSSALSAFNGTIGILLSSGIAFSCFYILMYRESPTFSAISGAAKSACVYSGYNLVSVIPSLAVLSENLKSKSDSAAVSVISGTAIFVLMSLIFAILSMYSGRISLGEFPMLAMAARQNRYFMIFYGALLAAAVVSTLFSASAGIAEAAGNRRSLIFMLFTAMSAYALSGLGFGKLVDTLYRISGIIGIIICAVISGVCIRKTVSSKSTDILRNNKNIKDL